MEKWLRHEAGQRKVRGTTEDQAVDLLIDVLTQWPAPKSVLSLLADNSTLAPASQRPIARKLGNIETEYLMMVASAALGGSDAAKAEHCLRVGTRSPDLTESLAAWKALKWWIEQSGRGAGVPLVSPSLESVRDIGIAIGTNQRSSRLGALMAACAVYRSQNLEFIEAVQAHVIQGLRQLRADVDYQTSQEDRQVAEQLPLCRHWCVCLAWVMTNAGKGGDEVVGSWIEAGDGDPLVIVRFVREWHAASKEKGGMKNKR